MDKASVADPLHRVAGDAAAALLSQPTYQRDKRARQKAARAMATERRAGAATLIAALWREAAVRNAATAARKVKARRAEVELAVVAARAETARLAAEAEAAAAAMAMTAAGTKPAEAAEVVQARQRYLYHIATDCCCHSQPCRLLRWKSSSKRA